MLRITLIFFLAIQILNCNPTEKIDLSNLPKISPQDMSTVYDENITEDFDRRFTTLRAGNNFPYEMPVYESVEAWEKRAKYLREHILICTGLWPMPEKTPLNTKVFDKIERDDYTIEKVYFESYPGFYVTGNLYRPNGKPGPFPAIISPHGHWEEGRLVNTEINSVPGRCINFARQGYVIFAYDMIGYADNMQVGHRFTDTKLHQAWGISILGLQLWNSIRALDFIETLPNVDTGRIGITGASGGGTQTFMATAVDDRIKVAAPVNMISAHFQGGCVCENVPGLRLETFNVEIGALAAPRPLLMVATTGDWTKNTPTVEYPMMQTIYKLYGAVDKVYSKQLDYPHNYNKDSRNLVYPWFAKWLLNDPDGEKYLEKDFTVEPDDKLRIFSNENPPPGDMDEEKLTEYLQNVALQSLDENWPTDKSSLKEFEDVYGNAMNHILATSVTEKVDVKEMGTFAGDGYAVSKMLISQPGKNNWIPALYLEPETKKRESALVVHPQGKSALVNSDGLLNSVIQSRLDDGKSVLLIDVFKTGEHVLPNGVEGRDETISHFTTFNKTDLMERVQDIVTAAAFLQHKNKLEIVGLKAAGAWALLAASQLENLETLTVDMNNTDFSKKFEKELFAPGIARVGHLQTAAMLTDAKKINMYNVHNFFDVDKITSKSVEIFTGEMK